MHSQGRSLVRRHPLEILPHLHEQRETGLRGASDGTAAANRACSASDAKGLDSCVGRRPCRADLRRHATKPNAFVRRVTGASLMAPPA